MKRLLISSLIAAALATPHLLAEWPQYVELDVTEKNRITKLKSGGAYLDEFYTTVINRNSDVQSVLEIGSGDARDALKLSEYYKCHVCTFECNPSSLQECLYYTGKNPNVSLVPYAAWDKTSVIDFFPVVETPGIFYNPGASSCFPVSKSGHHRKYVQSKIEVQAVRLDDWLTYYKISHVDLLCIDAQGATMNILRGLGRYLANVKYIITELDHTNIYEGETLKDSVDKFLEANGFKMYVGKMNRFFGDYLYIRKDIIAGWWGADEV